MNDIKHFEDVWNESESLAARKYKDAPASVIIEKIKTLLGSYDALNTFAESMDVRNTLKRKYMGEILFLISALSIRDDVNIWEALVGEVVMSSV